MDTVATVGCSIVATDATMPPLRWPLLPLSPLLVASASWLAATTDDCLTTSPTEVADCTADAVTGTAAAAQWY